MEYVLTKIINSSGYGYHKEHIKFTGLEHFAEFDALCTKINGEQGKKLLGILYIIGRSCYGSKFIKHINELINDEQTLVASDPTRQEVFEEYKNMDYSNEHSAIFRPYDRKFRLAIGDRYLNRKHVVRTCEIAKLSDESYAENIIFARKN